MHTGKCTKCGADVNGHYKKCHNCGTLHLSNMGCFLVLLFLILCAGIGSVIGTSLRDAKSHSEVDYLDKSSVPISSSISARDIQYEVLGNKSSYNGNQESVTLILIKPDMVNEADMIALGNKLRSDYQKDGIAFVYIYDDVQAANSRDAVLKEFADTNTTAYHDRHMVGAYTKNVEYNMNTYTIFYDGCNGSNSKQIRY